MVDDLLSLALLLLHSLYVLLLSLVLVVLEVQQGMADRLTNPHLLKNFHHAMTLLHRPLSLPSRKSQQFFDTVDQDGVTKFSQFFPLQLSQLRPPDLHSFHELAFDLQQPPRPQPHFIS